MPKTTKTLEAVKVSFKTELSGNTQAAITNIEKELRPDSDLFSEFIICKNKNNLVTGDHLKGIITEGEYSLRHAQIVNSILALIDRFEKKDLATFRNGNNRTSAKVANTSIQKAGKTAEGAEGTLISVLTGAKRRVVIIVSLVLILGGTVWLSRITAPLKVDPPPPESAKKTSKLPATTYSYSPADFEILDRKTVVNMRSIKKVPRKLKTEARYSAVFYSQFLTMEKKREGADIFLNNHWTSGFTMDVACATQECEFNPAKGHWKPGETIYNKYEIKFDVSKYPVYEPFTIHYQVIYWNNFQGEKTESVGVTVVPPTRKLTMEIYFPFHISKKDIWFTYERVNENDNKLIFENPKVQFNDKDNHLIWTIDAPAVDYAYVVNWNWDLNKQLKEY